jgi:ankyrin repeat protein
LLPNFLGQTPFQFAVIAQDFKVLKELFADFKLQALAQRDYLGENCLFECARNGNEAIFNWFMGTNDFFKARGTQNYKGRTIEHIVCMESQHPIVDEINPRPDTPDYYGNLPLLYSLMLDDLPMLEKQFNHGKEYFTLRNYKYETIFHVAARYNSLKSIRFVIGRNVFITQLLKRDYKGDTALHLAAKAGSYEVLEFMCNSVTPSFLAI